MLTNANSIITKLCNVLKHIESTYPTPFHLFFYEPFYHALLVIVLYIINIIIINQTYLFVNIELNLMNKGFVEELSFQANLKDKLHLKLSLRNSISPILVLSKVS
jgi:hypothetical protein